MPIPVVARGWSIMLALALLLYSATVSATTPTVKKSGSGICHPQDSAWFERTTRFTPYVSLQSCLDSGGRLPANYRASASKTGYDRAQFGSGWSDEDGDCQNSRAEALIATSTTRVRFADADRCRVITGRWISPFTEQVIQNASTIDIDHVVPLRWAWDRGPDEWLPPSGQCGYVARFLRIVRMYDLEMKAAEERSIRGMIARCQNS